MDLVLIVVTVTVIKHHDQMQLGEGLFGLHNSHDSACGKSSQGVNPDSTLTAGPLADGSLLAPVALLGQVSHTIQDQQQADGINHNLTH